MSDEISNIRSQELRKIAGKRRIAFLVVLLERLSGSFWLPLFTILFFAGIWLWEVQYFFGDIGGYLFLGFYAVSLWATLHKSFVSFEFPKSPEIDARLEKANDLKHRPIRSISDRLSNPEKDFTRELWNAQRNIWLGSLLKVKSFAPMPLISKKDPYGFRFIAILLFSSGLFVAGDSWKNHIFSGLMPFYNIETMDSNSGNVLVRIIPPEYTRMPQVTISGSGNFEEEILIPKGSTIKIFAKNKWFDPEISISKNNLVLNKDDDQTYSAEIIMDDSFAISGNIRISYVFGSNIIPYKIKDDLYPTISITKEHEVLTNSELKFHLSVNDDYVVKEIEFSMNIGADIDEPPLGSNIIENRTMMIAGGEEDVEISPYYDLTSHMWAGLPVEITFKAIDHQKQETISEIIKLNLPERKFVHPVAKYIIEQRQSLIWAPTGSQELISYKLAALLEAPDMFEYDIVAFLAIRAAASRLMHNRNLKSSRAVISLLWDTAVKIESGDLELAAREVRRLQQELEQALKDPETTDEELAEIMSNLNHALQDYFSQLQKELKKQMAKGGQIPIIPPNLLSQLVTPDELEDFMNDMFKETLNGNRDKAQEMLSDLQKMMDTLNPSVARPMPPDMQMMGRGVNELQELIEKQQLLLDQTIEVIKQTPEDDKENNYAPFEDSNSSVLDDMDDAMPPPPSNDTLSNNKEPMEGKKTEQEALRFILGRLMQEAGEILDDLPENLGKAEIEMRDSANNFGEGNAIATIPHQELAIEELKKGSDDLMKQLGKKLQMMTGMAFGQSARDPLGRPLNDGENSSILNRDKIKIPEGAQKKKAEEIIKKLRDKSSDWSRSEEELDYYRRLLERF